MVTLMFRSCSCIFLIAKSTPAAGLQHSRGEEVLLGCRQRGGGVQGYAAAAVAVDGGGAADELRCLEDEPHGVATERFLLQVAVGWGMDRLLMVAGGGAGKEPWGVRGYPAGSQQAEARHHCVWTCLWQQAGTDTRNSVS
jgi:hypothetical protein